MDEEKILVIIKGEDKTKEIEYLSENNNKKIDVKFYNEEKIYQYNQKNIMIKERFENIEFKDKDIYYKNQILFNVKNAIRFEEFIKIIYTTGETDIFRYNDISLKSNSIDNLNRDVIGYFKEISKYVKSGDDEKEENEPSIAKESFLKKEYEKLHYIDDDSVLNYYINKKDLPKEEIEINNIIYPFRFNLSQKKAMENVFKNKISIIQGPPGTGKTQTILNIIVNLAIMQNKTLAVVSNNNEAVKNVKDKLEKNGYGFIVADLGKKAKRKKFFEEIPKPKVENFYNQENDEILLNRINELNKTLNQLLRENNKKAELEKNIDNYKLEQKYFEEYYKKQNMKIWHKVLIL